MYFDCHTYHLNEDDSVISIVNYSSKISFENGQYYSIGIHPWDIKDRLQLEKLMEELYRYASKKNIIAIGECGLDRLHPEYFDIQLLAFEWQIKLANALHKPLIVHCVKAFGETIQLLKKATVPVIIHGVNNKLELVQPFLDKDYYLSFGSSILKEKSSSRKIIQAIPQNLLLLETDDVNIPIQTIYEFASELVAVEKESFNLQIQKNIQSIFNF